LQKSLRYFKTISGRSQNIQKDPDRRNAMIDKKLSKIFTSVRARVLLGCVLLMSFSALASILFIRQLLYVNIEERIEKGLQRKSGEFVNHTNEAHLKITQSSPQYPSALFESFVRRDVVKDQYYVMLINGQNYQTSERKLTYNFRFNEAQLHRLSKLSQAESSEIKLCTYSTIYYNATPVTLLTGQKGVFIVLFDATEDYEEISQAMIIIIAVTLGVLSISLIAAWFDTKRILQPLQLLTNTTRTITDADLTKRLPLVGQGEISDLTRNFNEMLERLQSSFSSQKNFLNYAGHELRTPLTIIRVNLEMLSDNPQERSETIQIMMDELDRMSRYVNEIIMLAKSEQPDFLMLETVRLDVVTQEIYDKVTSLGERNWQLEQIGKGTIVCDRHRITQVLMNLVQNATQQTKTGDAIVIGSMMKDGMANFWVRDTGVGIDPRVHQMIFDRFIRCPEARKRFEGMGLGLAIVKAIVNAHHGQVELVSKMNLGSTFTIKIPIDPPQETLHYNEAYSHY
jgi:signal transduction histidine kinase